MRTVRTRGPERELALAPRLLAPGVRPAVIHTAERRELALRLGRHAAMPSQQFGKPLAVREGVEPVDADDRAVGLVEALVVPEARRLVPGRLEEVAVLHVAQGRECDGEGPDRNLADGLFVDAHGGSHAERATSQRNENGGARALGEQSADALRSHLIAILGSPWGS